jgi:L-iditol 2-dehydrogenase
VKALVKRTWKPGFQLEEMATPEPAAGEVRLCVIGSAICGSDLHIYESAPGYEWLKLPMTPGHELVGRVEAVGDGVDHQWLGRRVVVNPYMPCGACEQCVAGRPNLCDGGKMVLDKVPSAALQIGFRRPGGMATHVTVPAANLLPVPDHVPDEVASMLESFAVSVHATEQVAVRGDETVLVIGPGPIGLGVVAALHAIGVQRILVAGLPADKARLAIAEQLGAKRAFDASVEPYRDVVQAETGGRGVDVVFDCSGHPAALTEAIAVAKRGGKIVLVGIYGKLANLPANAVVRGELSILGTYGTTPRAFDLALQMVSDGRADLRPMITHVLPLDQADKAFQYAQSKEGCKIVLKP